MTRFSGAIPALVGLLVSAMATTVLADGGATDLADEVAALKRANESLEHRLDELAKAVDDVAW